MEDIQNTVKNTVKNTVQNTERNIRQTQDGPQNSTQIRRNKMYNGIKC